MYQLSKKLIEKLDKHNIKYCHWKSNLLLNEALDGYDDLDLLVARGDIYRFEMLILSLGFKEASNRNISFYGRGTFMDLILLQERFYIYTSTIR